MPRKTLKTWTLARALPITTCPFSETWNAACQLPGHTMTDRERGLMQALFGGEISGSEAYLLLQAELQTMS